MKKMSLFFSKQVRQKMENDQTFTSLPGFYEAMRLPIEMFESVMNRRYSKKFADIDRIRVSKDGIWKHLYVGSHEHSELERAINMANRIECTISSYFPQTVIRSEVAFYRKGEKKHFYLIHLGVNPDTAKTLYADHSAPCSW